MRTEGAHADELAARCASTRRARRSDAEKVRQKQAAAEAKKAAEAANAKPASGGVVKQKFDIK